MELVKEYPKECQGCLCECGSGACLARQKYNGEYPKCICADTPLREKDEAKEVRLDCPNITDCVPERDCPFYPDVCGVDTSDVDTSDVLPW